MPKNNNSSESIPSSENAAKAKKRQQINIRLSQDDTQRLSELKDYWAEKGSIDFLHKNGSGTSVLDSNSTLARFIMETGLNYLYLDLINEKQIEKIAKGICKERKSNKKLKQQWQVICPIWETYKDSGKNEWGTYIDEINSSVKAKLKKSTFKATKETDWKEEDEMLFDSMWPIALSRSHSMNDDDLIDQALLTRTQILKEKYGKGDSTQ